MLFENLGGRRILVVEDSYILATSIAEFLEDMGCIVVGPTGIVGAALELARHAALDGATVDYNLHGRESLAVLDELRRRAIPVLIVTGYDRSVLPEPMRCLPILEKPFRPDDLQKRAASLFGLPGYRDPIDAVARNRAAAAFGESGAAMQSKGRDE